MYKKQVLITNRTGIHARPAAEFCKLATRYESDIFVKRLADNPQEGNAKSVINVMSLGLSKGVTIEIRAEGEDEQEAVEALVALVKSGLE